MKKKNMKKLGLLLATVCGVQVICATTSKGDEAKAGFLSRVAQTATKFFRGTANTSIIPSRAGVSTPNITVGKGYYDKVVVTEKYGRATFKVDKQYGENLNVKVQVNPSGTKIQNFKDGQLVSSGSTSGAGKGLITFNDKTNGIKFRVKNRSAHNIYDYNLKVGTNGASMQTHKNGILVSGGNVGIR